MTIEIILPIRLESPNVKRHWASAYSRDKKLKQAIGYSLNSHSEACSLRHHIQHDPDQGSNNLAQPEAFICVSMIRYGKRPLDTGDNLPFAFKSIRDSITGFFFPTLAPGRADSLPIFKFSYDQAPGEYSIKITITKDNPCTN